MASLRSCGTNMGMASPYTPQLTAFRAVVGGVERFCVEHEGTVYAVRRREPDENAGTNGDSGDEEREHVEIGGKLFAVADEKEVAVHGGRVLRCVEYHPRGGAATAALRLTVTEGKKEVADVVEPDGAVRVLGSENFFDAGTGTREHMVNVQGEEAAFVLLVSVREEDRCIVRIQRLN